MAVELGVGYVSIAPSARGFGAALDKEVQGPAMASGDKAGKGFSSKFGAGMASIGKAAAVGFGALAVGAGAGAFALYKVGDAFDAAYDKIRVGTGATGVALEGLQDDFKAVATSVPASFEDASTAIADLNQRLGLTGQPLQNLSAQFLELSRITETDLATNVDNLTRVFGDWQISTEQMPGALDAVYRASQASGIGVDKLSESVVQFGAPLRNLGFGFDESIALLAQFNKTGVNTETVFAGMKAGVGKLAKAGEPVPETFKRVVDEITKLGPGSEATAKAIELFGQRAGPDLADAIAGGKFELDDMLKAVTNGGDTIMKAGADTQDFSEKFLMLKNKVLVGLEPIAAKVFGALADGIDRVAPLMGELVGGFRAFVAAFRAGDGEITSTGFAGKLEAIGLKAREIFDNIVPSIKNVAAGFMSVVRAIQPFAAAFARFVAANPRPVLAALAVVIGAVLVGALWSMATAMAAAFAPVYLVVGAIALLAAGLVLAYQKVDWFRTAVDTVARFLTQTLWPAIQRLTASFMSDLVPALTTAYRWFSANILPILIKVATFIGGAYVAYFKLGIAVIKTIISVASSMYTWFNDNVMPVLRTVGGYVAGALSTAFGTAKTAINSIILVVANLYNWFNDNLKPILETIGTAVSGSFSLAFDTAKTAVQGVVDIISTVVSSVEGAIEKVNGLIDTVKGAATLDVGSIVAGGIPKMHTGGTVPGPPGSEHLRLLEAGEEVLSVKQANAMRATPAASLATATAGRGGPVNQFGDVHLHNEVDIDVLDRKMTFGAMAASL